MLSVNERSTADVNVKSAYVIEIMQKYIAKIAEIEESERKILLAQLIMREEDWIHIEGLELPEAETVPETEAPAETEAPGETTESEEFDPASRWTAELFEPDTPIVDTNYTMNEFDSIKEMLAAAAEFEPVIITYPCAYRTATEEEKAYFDPDTSKGLELYLQYRIAAPVEE